MSVEILGRTYIIEETTGLDLSKVDNMNVILGVISVSIGILQLLMVFIVKQF